MELSDGTVLHSRTWPGPAGAPPVVLLHAGVCDLRSWTATAELLSEVATVMAYDRRGCGLTPAAAQPFRHVDDLLEVLEQLAAGPVWLVGSSMGGALALDAVLSAPERVAGLVLIGSAVSGAPEPDLEDDPATLALDHRYEATEDLEEANRISAHLWLDGPRCDEGRVSGPARDLALAMNAVILAHGLLESDGDSGLGAFARLEDVRVPTTVACGDLDVQALVTLSEQVSARVPGARHVVLSGVAHLPYLEDPSLVADLVREALQSHT